MSQYGRGKLSHLLKYICDRLVCVAYFKICQTSQITVIDVYRTVESVKPVTPKTDLTVYTVLGATDSQQSNRFDSFYSFWHNSFYSFTLYETLCSNLTVKYIYFPGLYLFLFSYIIQIKFLVQ